jgi:hypothetical protein
LRGRDIQPPLPFPATVSATVSHAVVPRRLRSGVTCHGERQVGSARRSVAAWIQTARAGVARGDVDGRCIDSGLAMARKFTSRHGTSRLR